MSSSKCSVKSLLLDKVTTIKFPNCSEIIPTGVITITKYDYRHLECFGCTGITGFNDYTNCNDCNRNNKCNSCIRCESCQLIKGTGYHFLITQLDKQLNQRSSTPNEIVEVANFAMVPNSSGSYGLTANSSNNTAIIILDSNANHISVDAMIGSITFGILRYVITIENNRVTATVEQTFDSANNQDDLLTCSSCRCLADPNLTNSCNVKVPIINILAQLNVLGTDVADVIFTICDQYQYYNCIPEPANKCQLYYIKHDQLLETRFQDCCLELVSVLKGKGVNLYEKLISIYKVANLDITFDQFYSNVMIYALSRYILSRILFGKFKLKYLLGKYNEQFLKSLGHSRFCGFMELFISCESNVIGYDKYFKFGKVVRI